MDFAKHFSTTKFEEKIKQMNGYQAHVASPEMAMRALVADAFQDAAPVAQWMIVQMRTFLSQSTREIANEVAERDPEKRSDITDMIAQVGALSYNHCGHQLVVQAPLAQGLLVVITSATVLAVFNAMLAKECRTSQHLTEHPLVRGKVSFLSGEPDPCAPG